MQSLRQQIQWLGAQRLGPLAPPVKTPAIRWRIANIAKYQLPLNAYRLEAWDAMSSDQAQAYDGFMEDFGEQVTPDMRFADGESGTQMHNYYPLPYHHATRTFLDSYAAAPLGTLPYFFHCGTQPF